MYYFFSLFRAVLFYIIIVRKNMIYCVVNFVENFFENPLIFFCTQMTQIFQDLRRFCYGLNFKQIHYSPKF
jgi:hypothetical protein